MKGLSDLPPPVLGRHIAANGRSQHVLSLKILLFRYIMVLLLLFFFSGSIIPCTQSACDQNLFDNCQFDCSSEETFVDSAVLLDSKGRKISHDSAGCRDCPTGGPLTGAVLHFTIENEADRSRGQCYLVFDLYQEMRWQRVSTCLGTIPAKGQH
jgi:hypothetical protein